jgi:hypothetical protein
MPGHIATSAQQGLNNDPHRIVTDVEIVLAKRAGGKIVFLVGRIQCFVYAVLDVCILQSRVLGGEEREAAR